MTGAQRQHFLELLDVRDCLKEQTCRNAEQLTRLCARIIQQEETIFAFIEKLEEESFARGINAVSDS